MFDRHGILHARRPKHQMGHDTAVGSAKHRITSGGTIENGDTISGTSRPSGHTPWRLHWYTAVTAVLILSGLTVFIYPSAASWFSQSDQAEVINTNIGQVSSPKLSPSIAQQLRDAHEYNTVLSSTTLTEAGWNPSTVASSLGPGGALDYDRRLVTPSGVMARLRIPSIDVDLPIYHGTSDSTLMKGVGHLEGTSLPVGGNGTHAVLTAHRGLASAMMFTNLNKMVKGDTFTIDVMNQVLTYRVSDIRVVDPDDTASLKATPNKDLVTLVTCTPLGINSQRILVTGERVSSTSHKDGEAADKPPELPGFPWWAVFLAGGFLVVAIFVWRSGYSRQRYVPHTTEERRR